MKNACVSFAGVSAKKQREMQKASYHRVDGLNLNSGA